MILPSNDMGYITHDNNSVHEYVYVLYVGVCLFLN